MKILFLTHLYHPAVGGAERVFRRLAEGLAARGHDVTVLTSDALSTNQFFTRAGNGIPLRETLGRVRIVRESIQASPYRALRLADKAARRLGRLGVFYRPLVFGPHFRDALPGIFRADYDVVVAGPTPTTALFYGIAYKWRHPRTRLILFPHMHIKDRLHTTYLNRWALRRADVVLALTEAERAFLGRKRVRRERIVRIVNAVDDHVFEAPPSPGSGTDGYVLYLGQESGHKRIPLLIGAMRNLWERGFEAGLVIAGARTDYSPALDRIIAGLPEEHRRRIDRRNDITEEAKAGLIDGCRVLVNPSSYEAFGLVFLEAWARRKPVIGADIPAVREIIGTGDKGLLFRDRSAADLEDKIALLLQDGGRAEAMGRAGFAEVAAKYRWDQVVRGLEAALGRG